MQVKMLLGKQIKPYYLAGSIIRTVTLQDVGQTVRYLNVWTLLM